MVGIGSSHLGLSYAHIGAGIELSAGSQALGVKRMGVGWES